MIIKPKPSLIVIDGIDGSGKTTLIEKIKNRIIADDTPLSTIYVHAISDSFPEVEKIREFLRTHKVLSSEDLMKISNGDVAAYHKHRESEMSRLEKEKKEPEKASLAKKLEEEYNEKTKLELESRRAAVRESIALFERSMQHTMNNVVFPALRDNIDVVMDRGVLSFFAYNVESEIGIHREEIQEILDRNFGFMPTADVAETLLVHLKTSPEECSKRLKEANRTGSSYDRADSSILAELQRKYPTFIEYRDNPADDKSKKKACVWETQDNEQTLDAIMGVLRPPHTTPVGYANRYINQGRTINVVEGQSNVGND